MGAWTSAEDLTVSRTVDRELQWAGQSIHAQASPQAVLLAGQPGAGKTILSTLMISGLNDDAALVNEDEYRRYYPNYRALYKKIGSDVVAKTSPFSNAVTETLIQRFSDLHYNMVVEGTGRSVEVPKSTSELLNARGYSVEMAVIATRPLLSLISTVKRFYEMNARGTTPRATAVEAHDHVVAALPGNLDALYKLPTISRIRIWTRDTELQYDSQTADTLPSTALRGVWSAKWSPKEIAATEKSIAKLRSLEKKSEEKSEEKHGFGQGPVIDEIQKLFQQEISNSK